MPTPSLAEPTCPRDLHGLPELARAATSMGVALLATTPQCQTLRTTLVVTPPHTSCTTLPDTTLITTGGDSTKCGWFTSFTDLGAKQAATGPLVGQALTACQPGTGCIANHCQTHTRMSGKRSACTPVVDVVFPTLAEMRLAGPAYTDRQGTPTGQRSEAIRRARRLAGLPLAEAQLGRAPAASPPKAFTDPSVRHTLA